MQHRTCPLLVGLAPRYTTHRRRLLHCGIFSLLYVRFGSEADLKPPLSYVRFTPESGQRADMSERPLCAKSEHMQCSKIY